MNQTDITLEQVESFVQMLTGGDTGDIKLSAQPKLTRKQAFSVVWWLQEEMHVLPDRFEMCDTCDELLDSECEHWFMRKGDNAGLCDDCSRGYDLCESCQELVALGTTDDGVCAECREAKNETR